MLALAFATSKEMRAALAFAGPPPVAPAPADGAWSRLVLPGGAGPDRKVLVLVTGVSMVNAALALGRLLGAEPVTGVCNLGIAGSFDADAAPLGATTVADGECWPEFGVLREGREGREGGVDPEALGLPLLENGQGRVTDRLNLDPNAAAAAMGLRLDPAWARGTSLTVSGVTATAARAAELRERHGALTENMEGFALALGCRRAGIPFLEVRTVSNMVGPREGTWDLQGALAALGRTAGRLLGSGSQGA